MKKVFLGQIRPGDTNNHKAAYSDKDSVVTKIIVCETSGGAATFRIYYDHDGTQNDQETAIYYDHALSANETLNIETFLPILGKKGAIYVRSNTASAITFTFTGEQK